MRMRWVDLLFAHWPMDPDALRASIPPELELDTFEGRAYLGVVPFRMEDVGMRGLPAPPVLGAFPELNVRTYVRYRGQAGVWFLSLDAASRMTVIGARRWFHLPYVLADMQVTTAGDTIDYRSRRTDEAAPPATFRARFGPTGPVEATPDDSLEAWLTQRWRLFARRPDGTIERSEIRHAPWPLQPAWAALDATSIVAAHGLTLPDAPPHLRFARRVDVVGWWPRRA
jgi:uncharacterized protein YqjF (DUF2071 family)